MKKKVLSVLLCAAMVATLAIGCGGNGGDGGNAGDDKQSTSDDANKGGDDADKGGSDKKVLAVVPKSAGNPYNEREVAGFEEVAKAAGDEVVVKYPEQATADAQQSVIQSLISQDVDAICLAANDENALQASLEDAMAAGIKVCCMDSKVNAASRATFVNQAGTKEIGETLMEAVYDLADGEGKWAILSATSQAANQNAWIDAMKEIMKDEKYSKLELVEVAYGDDEPQKSTDQTQALLEKYSDLKVICAPTTVGINAAAKVLQDKGSSVKLTGLGLPSEMAEYIGEDDEHSCPYMYLWNPIDVGKLGAYVSIALVEGDITGAEGETFTAGDLGEYTIVDAGDGGTEIILGAPFKFDPSNIEEWKEIY